MASANGIVGEENKVVDKIENGAEIEEKDLELMEKEGEKQVVGEKETEKAERDGKGEEGEEEVGEKAEENSDEEVGKKSGHEKVVAKKRRSGSSVKEAPVTPIERPSRERKTVERYMEMADSRSSAGKAVLIEKGNGIPLKDIPNVAFKLSKIKPDDNLKLLHSVLFGKRVKVHTLKRNIGLFSGFVWDVNEEKQRIKVKERIDRCVKDKLLLFCDILNIPVNRASAKKEDLSLKLLEFLESPHVTTEKLLADSEKGKKQKRKAKYSKSPGSVRKASKTSKKQKLESESEKKRKSPFTDEEEDDDEVERSESRDVSQDDDENDVDAKEETDQDSKSKEEVKDDADSKEESDEGSKSEEEEYEENEKSKPRRQMTSKKSSSKAVGKNDSGVKTADKSTSVKMTRPTKSSKTTPKPTKKSLMSTDDAEKNDTSVASGSSGKPKVPSTKKQKLDKEHEDQSLSAKVKTSGKKEPGKSSTKSLAKDQVGNKKGRKKAKPEPSKEEMHAVVANILKEVDFNTATLSDILQKLCTHFDVDLSHRKAEVRLIITDVISNMTDEEDDEEEENGEDEEADGEDDNDA